ncbi:MAG TPA: glycosyltransferase family 4 protein [Gaiellaceae bacterium]
MRVAYYSPLPPETSGIADYSALLLPALRERIEVEVVKRGRTKPPRGTEVSLYHVGNSPEAHAWIVDALRRRPGVVVLHELVLHHLIAGMTIGRKDGRGYLDALERDSGLPGRLLAHGVLEGRVPPLWEMRPEDFPLAGAVLDRATGLIVHSRYVEDGARRLGYEGPLWRIPHPAWPAPEVVPAAVDGSPLIGCFGHLNASKRIPQLLEAFRLLPETARLLLVGPVSPRYDLDAVFDRYGADRVTREAYVPEARLWSLMAACDVLVSLRAPTMGETSGSALRALSLGKPLVVSDVGWFSELEGAARIPVGDGEVEALFAALVQPPEPVRAGLEHDVARVADRYAAALEEAGGGEAVRDGVLHEVAAAAAAVGIEDTAELSSALREVGLGE